MQHAKRNAKVNPGFPETLVESETFTVLVRIFEMTIAVAHRRCRNRQKVIAALVNSRRRDSGPASI
jgi:hypothetical protein